MAEKESFQTRVKNTIIEYARQYKAYFVDYDYLICSDVFKNADYYIVQAHETNFKHLTGVSSGISAREFFDKCYNGTLEENDFSVTKKGVPDKNAKGTIRRKMKALPGIIGIFNAETIVEEDYNHNSIKCSFIAGDKQTTIGFAQTNPVVPLTLLLGEKTNQEKSGHISLVLRRKSGEKLFSEIILGNVDILEEKKEIIAELLSNNLK